MSKADQILFNVWLKSDDAKNAYEAWKKRQLDDIQPSKKRPLGGVEKILQSGLLTGAESTIK